MHAAGVYESIDVEGINFSWYICAETTIVRVTPGKTYKIYVSGDSNINAWLNSNEKVNTGSYNLEDL